MTISTWIVLGICCFLCPMGMFVVMNSKRNNKDNNIEKKEADKNVVVE